MPEDEFRQAKAGLSDVHKISKATLSGLLSQRAYRSHHWHISKATGPVKIPDFELLKAGDIVLTRERFPFSIRRMVGMTEKPGRIVRAQMAAGIPKDIASWTHVAVYVGNLHVVESIGIKDFAKLGLWNRSSWKLGVQCNSLLKYTDKHDVMILRYRAPNIEELGTKIAYDALFELTLGKRKYDYVRALYLGIPEKIRRHLGPNLQNRTRRIICSDLALECYYDGAKLLVDVTKDVQNGNREFYPAHFACEERFEEIELAYFELES